MTPGPNGSPPGGRSPPGRPAEGMGAEPEGRYRLVAILATGLGCLLFLGLFLLSERDLARQEEMFVAGQHTEAWTVHQLDRQYNRLRAALAEYRAAAAQAMAGTPAQADYPAGQQELYERLVLQFELLWSRVELLRIGPEAAALATQPGTRELEGAFRTALEEVEHLMPALQAGDPDAMAQASALLAGLDSGLARFGQQVIHLTPSQVRADREARRGRIGLYLAMMLALALGFTLTLGHELFRNRRLAEQARLAERRAAEESAAKSVFLATVSHEVRTPLNAIGGFAELIERQPFGPVGHRKYLEYVRDIIASSAHLQGLLDDVADTQQVLAGRITLQESEVALRPFLAETLRIVRANCVGRYPPPRIATRVESLTVLVDRRRLRQVLINLLNNAIRYSEGQAEITITAGLADGQPEFIIADQGPGITAHLLPRVFEPFQRGDQNSVAGTAGMGLGLTIVRNIVEAHGGNVRIENGSPASLPPVKGVIARVRLPASRHVRVNQPRVPRLSSIAAE